MRSLLLLCAALSGLTSFAQTNFQSAYQEHPYVPSGLLEAVAWTQTRMTHLGEMEPACSGIPQAYGIMGLHDNGKNYFRENGAFVAQLSGISIAAQKNSADQQVFAYAKAFNSLMMEEVGSPKGKNNPSAIRNVLHILSEIPDSGAVNRLAQDLQVYSILEFLTDPQMAERFAFNLHSMDLPAVFGAENYQVLSGKKIVFTEQGITTGKGHFYKPSTHKSADYGPALWNPAATCNFSSRLGVAISAITIHTVQGTYAGCISWFQNCSASVSAHYVVRSSDGQVTQMVNESDKAWHVGSENPYTIGHEHEGYVSNPAWYTEAMYTASANICRDIITSGYGINPLRTFDGPATSGSSVLGGCIRIKGHQHYPNQTHVDPGINWDWEHYYQLINDPPNVITVTAPSGNLYDTGGPSGNYPDDQRQLWRIQPPTALTVTLEFTAFELENNWDYLYIYDGDSLNDPLIGVYTGTTSPGTIFSTGNSLLLEFRSDCSTTAPGWVASYMETSADATPPLTSIQQSALWYTDDFTVDFIDTDAQSTISDRFYLAASKDNIANDWSAIGSYGFVHESFADGDANWLPVTGTFSVSSEAYIFADELEQNSNAYLAVDQANSALYLYEWDQTITSAGTSQRAGMHFFCDNPNLPNRGNSYFIYMRENDDKLQIYEVVNDVFALVDDIPFIVNAGQNYNLKTIYNPSDGQIRVYVDDVLISSWQDLTPLTSGGYISLRTGGCAATFDNIRVYQSRGTQAMISAGFSELFSIESLGAQASGMARSLALDNAGNWSLPATDEFLLDFTPPLADYVYDGATVDIDTFVTATLEANWNVLDPHSDMAFYEVAVGTLPNLDDVYPWSNQGSSSMFSTILSNPVYNQVYYLSIRAYNNAGLSDQFMSNGQRFLDDLGLDEMTWLNDCLLYPNPAKDYFSISGLLEAVDVKVFDAAGRLCVSAEGIDSNQSIFIENLSRGHYSVWIQNNTGFILRKLVVD